jgi:hypothetical protein
MSAIASSPTLGNTPCRFVRIPAFAKISGYTEKAIRRKIDDGVWVEGHQYRRAPDGRLVIDIVGFEAWVTK